MWTQDSERLLVDWSGDLLVLRAAHLTEASRLEVWHRWTWIPGLVSTNLGIAAQVYSIIYGMGALRPAVLALSVLASTLSGLQLVLRLPQRATQHRQLANTCWRLWGDIAFQLSLPVPKRTACTAFMERIRLPYSEISTGGANLAFRLRVNRGTAGAASGPVRRRAHSSGDFRHDDDNNG